MHENTCLCNLASSRVDVLGSFKPRGNDTLLAQQDYVKALSTEKDFFWIMVTSDGKNRKIKRKLKGTICTHRKRSAQSDLIRGNRLLGK